MIGFLNVNRSRRVRHSDSMADLSYSTDSPNEHIRALGLDKSKDEFLQMVGMLDTQDANQLVIARLMHEVLEMCEEQEEAKSRLNFLNFYKCIHPEGYFMWLWTIVYISLILYIATWGLFRMTFMTSSHDCTTPFDWFEFGIDTFFVIDIFCRSFVFGQIVERPGFFSEMSEVVLEPAKVLKLYIKTGLAVDILTGIPYSWIGMTVYGCDGTSTGASDVETFRVLRIVRATRVTRVLKLFRQPQVRKAIRQFKQYIGHNNMIQLASLLVVVLILNHILTCASWLVQSADIFDRDDDGLTGFEEFQQSIALMPWSTYAEKYSLMFMITLQSLFAIDPAAADTPLEAWFGVMTLLLSVCVHATIVTYVIQIWEAINRASTQMDARINGVISFLRNNNIDGDLRSDVLEYFEFMFSNSSDLDNDSKVLDSLPTDIQSRIIHRIFPRALETAYLFSNCSEAFVSQLIIRSTMLFFIH